MSTAAKTPPWAASLAAVFLILGLVASLYYNQLDPMYLGLSGYWPDQRLRHCALGTRALGFLAANRAALALGACLVLVVSAQRFQPGALPERKRHVDTGGASSQRRHHPVVTPVPMVCLHYDCRRRDTAGLACDHGLLPVFIQVRQPSATFLNKTTLPPSRCWLR